MPKKTRRAAGTGSLRKRPDGLWEARATTGYDPKTGKQLAKSVYGRTQADARIKLNKMIAEIDEGTYLEPSKMPLEVWVKRWLEEYTFDKKYSTIKNYKTIFNSQILPKLGKLQLCELDRMRIQRFYNELYSPRDGSKGISAKTIRNVHGLLNKIMGQAVMDNLIRMNPCSGAVLPRKEKTIIKPLTDEQLKDLLLAADDDPDYGNLIKLVALTGLRESEALGLTWDCVNFKRGTILIEKQLLKRPLKDGGICFSSPKNSRPRSIMPAPYVMEILEDQKKMQERYKRIAGSCWEDWKDESRPKCRLVFTTITGSYISPGTMRVHFKKIAEQIGCPEARVHDLRHTYAMVSLENGDDIKTVQGNLGHATAAFTLDVYGHVSDRMKKESSSRMEEFIRSLTEPEDKTPGPIIKIVNG
ncbi:MAG: site-specific integrase [Oscillospiraceae bacterium]|nr:site-specific integrase [Oscillospiraceae bacterium]MBR4657365.1 site-specific integrase [Oscillospiraceae bacterium]